MKSSSTAKASSTRASSCGHDRSVTSTARSRASSRSKTAKRGSAVQFSAENRLASLDIRHRAVSVRRVGRIRMGASRSTTPFTSGRMPRRSTRSPGRSCAIRTRIRPWPRTTQVVMSNGNGRTGSSSAIMPNCICSSRLRERGGGGNAVIGRACTIHSVLSAYAHSMSCGRPKCSSIRPATATRSASHPEGPSRLSARPDSSGGSARAPRSTTRWSAVTAPDTTASPRPSPASITISVRAPVTGLAVKPPRPPPPAPSAARPRPSAPTASSTPRRSR